MANKQTLIKLTENKLKHNPPTHNHHHLNLTVNTSVKCKQMKLEI